jgi:hypothetical protein
MTVAGDDVVFTANKDRFTLFNGKESFPTSSSMSKAVKDEL